MANIESEKVRKTLMLYMTIRWPTLPRVYSKATSAAPPMSRMPFRVVSRSESEAKRCGTQLSTAMLESTRGPSRKPVCAATTSRAAAANRVATTRAFENGKGCSTASASTAFIVLPGTGTTCQRR